MKIVYLTLLCLPVITAQKSAGESLAMVSHQLIGRLLADAQNQFLSISFNLTFSFHVHRSKQYIVV
jgi:hypothetical protein